MGFDVLYFTPIHPIGKAFRKGRNNTLTPGPDDPGSPYAIGSPEGGHDAIHPQLGTLEDFRALREAGVTADRVPTLSVSITENELKGLDLSAGAGDYLAASYFQSVDTPAGRRFGAVTLDTSVGGLVAAVDPAVLGELPPAGGVFAGTLWLSGRVLP